MPSTNFISWKDRCEARRVQRKSMFEGKPFVEQTALNTALHQISLEDWSCILSQPSSSFQRFTEETASEAAPHQIAAE
jgi:hypothetical protein